MEDIISQAKAEFTRAQDRIARVLNSTPDDKINWAPSELARTPVQLVAHAGMGTRFLQDMFDGKPFPYASMAEMDAKARKAEKEFTTREQALTVLERTSKDYFAWLDTLTPEQIASTLQLPFGEIRMAEAITFPADHLRSHASQIEYIQTIFGDYDM